MCLLLTGNKVDREIRFIATKILLKRGKYTCIMETFGRGKEDLFEQFRSHGHIKKTLPLPSKLIRP